MGVRHSKAATIVAGAVFVASCAIARPATAQQQAPAAPPPGQPKAPPAPKAAPTTYWWCEVSSQPAAGVQLTQDEKDHLYFVSQVIGIRHSLRSTEDDLRRHCRATFEVQFGTKLDVITANVYKALSPDEADNDRRLDMSIGDRLNHSRDFRMSAP